MIDIKNNNVILYLETVLNKNIKNINIDDITNLKMLVIDCSNDETFDYSIIKYFKNLDTLSIFNSNISEEDINLIEKNTSLATIKIVKSSFDNEKSLEKLSFIKSLELSNCVIKNYEFLNKMNMLEVLKVQNPSDETVIDLSNIENCFNLKQLVLNYCILDNVDKLGLLTNCELLSLLGTEINKFMFLQKMVSLRNLFISEKYVNDVKKLSLSSKINFDLIDYYFDKEEETDDFNLTRKLN